MALGHASKGKFTKYDAMTFLSLYRAIYVFIYILFFLNAFRIVKIDITS